METGRFPSKAYALFRGIVFALYLALYGLNVINNPRPLTHFHIYLTNWGTTLILIREWMAFYFALRAAVAAAGLGKAKKHTFIDNLHFLISNVASSLS